MCAEIVQNGSLDSAETQIVRGSLNFDGAKMQLAFLRPGKSRVRTFFQRAPSRARSLFRRAPSRARARFRFHVIKQSVSAGNNQADCRQFRRVWLDMRLEENCVHMAFKMIHRNKWLTEFESQNFAVRHTNEQ